MVGIIGELFSSLISGQVPKLACDAKRVSPHVPSLHLTSMAPVGRMASVSGRKDSWISVPKDRSIDSLDMIDGFELWLLVWMVLWCCCVVVLMVLSFLSQQFSRFYSKMTA